MHWTYQTPSCSNTREDSTHRHNQMVNIKIRLIIFLAPKMQKLYTVSKNKTGSSLWHRPWTPYCQIQTQLKKVRKTIRPFWYKLNQIPYDYTVEVRNRFKGLDLIDRVPHELWMEVCDIVQEERDRDHPQEKEMQKSKMAAWGGLIKSWEKKS